MSLQTHYTMVEEKHTKLEHMIAQEALRPSPDFVMLQTLKKQKLLLKEELERIRHVEKARPNAA